MSTSLADAPGEVDLPDIDINWLEPERLDIQVIQQNDALNAWSTAQVDAPLFPGMQAVNSYTCKGRYTAHVVR